MPTLPLKATPLPKPGGPRMEMIQRAFEMLPNTAPFDEVSIYRAASAFENAGDWMGVRP